MIPTAPILHLLHGPYPDDPRVRRQAEELVRAGLRVRVLATATRRERAAYVLRGVEVEEAPLSKVRAGPGRYLAQYLRMTAWARRRVRRACAGEGLGLVQVATLPDFLVWAAGPARRRGVPVVLDLHESMPDFFASKYAGWPARLLRGALERLERHCAARADALLTVNEEIADTFERRLGRRPLVVSNGADESRFDWRRSEPLWPAGPKTLAYHGTISDLYGLDLLLEALPRVLARHPGTRVEIFGDGPALPGLRQRCRSLGLDGSVTFHGRVPHDAMSERLGTVHVGIVPTRKDEFLDMSLGNKLLELVHLGVPVVASDLRAVRRVFGSPDTLWFFEGNRAVSLAESLARLLEAPAAEVASRVAAARERYRPLSWPVMARRYVDLIRTLAGGGGP